MPDGFNLSSESKGSFVLKSLAAPAPGGDTLEFVMSDETVDRYGDIIMAAGWQLANFKKNPIALFGHSSSFVIGNWRDVRVEGSRLLGRLELMAPVSERLQEVQAAVHAGVLRAVSVGFHSSEIEMIKDSQGRETGGVRFLKSELVECSVVAVPANPNALQVAKALNLSRETQQLIFGESAERGRSLVRGFTGGPADTTRSGNALSQGKPQMSLSELIQGSEQRLVQLQDNLRAHLEQSGGVPSEESKSLRSDIEAEKEILGEMQLSERALGNQSNPVGNSTSHSTATAMVPYAAPRPRDLPTFAQPKRKELRPADYVFRAATIGVLHHVTKQPHDVLLRQHYGEDNPTKIVANVLLRSASVPATTTLTGWAAELVQTVVLDLLDVLVPNSVYRALAARGARFTFGQSGVVSLPSLSTTPTIAGAFVAEGSPIPVRQAAFTSVSLTPKKMAVISTFTREISEHSTPQIEALIRQIMQEGTESTLDSILLDATVASTTRPAGLRYGVANTNIVTGGGIDAVVGDIKAMLQSLATNKALRDPVWIMNPVDRIAASFVTNGNGEFIFKDELTQGTLGGFPVISSENVTSGMVLLVNAADFFSATGDEPRFEVSDSAVLHMEDTSPAAIVSGGTAASGAVRSLWQTDSLAIRMIWPMNWAMRRTGGVAWSASVAW